MGPDEIGRDGMGRDGWSTRERTGWVGGLGVHLGQHARGLIEFIDLLVRFGGEKIDERSVSPARTCEVIKK